MARSRRALTIVAVLLAAVDPAASMAAPADDDAAEIMFQRGLADMLAGRYASGCPAIAQSLRLDPRPGTLFTLAECRSRAGLIASALGDYDQFLRLVAEMPDEAARRQHEREQIAREQSTRLASIVPTLTITLAGGIPPGTVVERDGARVPEAELGAAVRVDPGAHTVTAIAADGRRVERSLALEASDRRELTISPLDLTRPLLAASPPSPPPAPAVGSRWAGRLDIAGAALAAGGVAALWIAKAKVDSIDSARAAGRPFDDADGNFPTYQRLGAALLTAGVVALLSGLTLHFVAPRSGRSR